MGAGLDGDGAVMACAIVMKPGRCSTGAQRDSGTVSHLLPLGIAEQIGSGGTWAKALCGTVPGKTTQGWAYPPPNRPRMPQCENCRERHNIMSGLQHVTDLTPEVTACRAWMTMNPEQRYQFLNWIDKLGGRGLVPHNDDERGACINLYGVRLTGEYDG